MRAAACWVVLGGWRDLARWVLALASLAMALTAAEADAQSGEARLLARRSASHRTATTAALRAATPALAESASALADPALLPAPVPPQRESFPIGLEVALATQAPLSLGAEATIELPLGFLLRGHVGFVPEPYVRLMNEVASGIGAYGDEIASLVDRSGSNSLVLRFSGGIRPVPGYGFEIVAGYTRVVASTRVSVEDFEAATGQSMRWPGLQDVGIDAELHMVHVQLGWTALLWDHVAIRVMLGWAHTLGASSGIDVPDDLRDASGGMVDEIERDLHDGLTSYAFTPELGLAAGYRF